VEIAMQLNKHQITTAPAVTLAVSFVFGIWLNMAFIEIRAEHFDTASAIQSIMRLEKND
jgi:hypothetical protein